MGNINWRCLLFPQTKLVLKKCQATFQLSKKCFCDILPKEQFYGLLWEYEFGMKRVLIYYKGISHIMSLNGRGSTVNRALDGSTYPG